MERDRLCRRAAHAAAVSIHAPTWSATSLSSETNKRQTRFQSTRPRGARQLFFASSNLIIKFQSTRPRGARRVDDDFATIAKVSIHAPTWSATSFTVLFWDPKIVSIHAPTWSATGVRLRNTGYRSFNPRAHVERDNDAIEDQRTYRRFNPRAHVERDKDSPSKQ